MNIALHSEDWQFHITQMNVRRPLIVKKPESGYESLELDRRVCGNRFTTTSGSNIPNGSSQMANAPNVTFMRHV